MQSWPLKEDPTGARWTIQFTSFALPEHLSAALAGISSTGSWLRVRGSCAFFKQKERSRLEQLAAE